MLQTEHEDVDRGRNETERFRDGGVAGGRAAFVDIFAEHVRFEEEGYHGLNKVVDNEKRYKGEESDIEKTWEKLNGGSLAGEK